MKSDGLFKLLDAALFESFSIKEFYFDPLLLFYSVSSNSLFKLFQLENLLLELELLGKTGSMLAPNELLSFEFLCLDDGLIFNLLSMLNLLSSSNTISSIMSLTYIFTKYNIESINLNNINL